MTALPIPDAALDDRLAFVGTAGSGKTYGAGTAVERLLSSGGRVGIVDPLGVWWGLRLKPDGTTPAFEIPIFGGPHGDLPITENSGAVIAEACAEATDSFIIDLSELGSNAAERRFMLAFLTELYRKTNKEPRHLVIDEADMFAPQQISDRDGGSTRLLGIMETIVRRGRVKGFIPWLITQRPAVLNKNVLSQADGLISFKLTSSQDRDAIGAWVQGQADKAQWRDIWSKMPTMPTGTGMVWIPARSILETSQFPAKKTFDSSRTPKRGETRTATKLRPLDIGALKARLSVVEQEAATNDPKELRVEVARLKRELAAKPSPPDRVEISAAEFAGFQRGHKAAVECAMGIFVRMQGELSDISGRIGAPPSPVSTALLAKHAEHMIDNETVRVSTPTANRIIPTAEFVPGRRGDLSPSARKILSQIHNAYPMALSFEAASLRAGISRRSSALSKYLQEVTMSGEVDQRSDGKLVSSEGFAQPVESGDPIEAFAARLPPSYAKMLRVVAESRRPLLKEEIAQFSNVSPTSSGLTAGLNELIALALIQKTGNDYRINPDLR